MNLFEILINILIISIPEELFITIIALVIMGKTEYFVMDNLKRNFFRIMFIVVIPFAIFTNITLIQMDQIYNLLINIIFFSICLGLFLKVKNIEDVIKILFSSSISILMFVVMQLITTFLCKFILKMDITAIVGVNPLDNFRLFLPERLFEYYIILIILLKINGSSENGVLSKIYKNSKVKWLIGIFYSINLVLFFAILESFITRNTLIFIETTQKIMLVTITISLVILNLAIPWLMAIAIYSSEDKTINSKK